MFCIVVANFHLIVENWKFSLNTFSWIVTIIWDQKFLQIAYKYK